MANQLKLQVLLAAVDKITRPLKSIQQAAGHTSQEMRDTQARVKELNQATGQIDGYRKVSRQVGITGNELKKLQGHYRELQQQIKSTENPSKSLTRELEQARSKYQQVMKQQRRNIQIQNEHRQRLEDAGISTKKLSGHQQKLADQVADATRALEQQKGKLAEINAQQKKLNAARQQYDKTLEVRGSLATRGATAAAAGGGAIYAASQVLAPGLEFGAAISKLQALTRLEGTSVELEKLRNQARELGANTSFSAVDVAAGQAFLAMAGFTPASIQAAMPGLLDLSKAGGVELGATADIASNILSAFKMEASEMGRVADVLAYTTTTSNTDLTMLAETMKYMAPIAQTAGLSLAESAAAAGLLGNIGIQASNSGTALRAMLNRLAGPTKAASKLMEELGVSAKDSNGDMRNIVEVMTDVAKATEAMGSADRLSIYKTLFGEEAAAGMNELVSQSGAGGFAKYAMEIDTSSVGAAAQMAKTMSDNAQGDLQSLSSAWQDVGIELFDNNNSGIRDLIQDITGLPRAVGTWIKANPELVATLSKVFAVIAALAIAGGTLALTIAGLLGPFAAMRYAVQVLGIKALPSLLPMLKAVGAGFIKLGVAMLTTPIGWLIMGIAALAGAGYLIYKNWDAIKAYMAAFWQGVEALAAAGIEVFKTIFGWSPLGLLINNWSQITGWFSTLPEQFRQYGANILDGLLAGITGKLAAVKDKIVGAGKAVAGWFKDTLGIRSPSRVFTQFGDDTMAGLANGLAKNHDPEQQVTATAKRLKAAGAGIALGMAAMPVAAALPPVTDAQRIITERLQPAGLPPIPDETRTIRERVERAQLPDTSAAVARIQTQQQEQAQSRPAPAAPAPQQHTTVFEPSAIVIHAAPGMDPQELALQVQRQIEAHERRKAAQSRARLTDLE